MIVYRLHYNPQAVHLVDLLLAQGLRVCWKQNSENSLSEFFLFWFLAYQPLLSFFQSFKSFW